MVKISAGPTTKIKNGIGGIVLNRIQKRPVILTDVVISSAIPVCLRPQPSDHSRRSSLLTCDAIARHRLEMAHAADYSSAPLPLGLTDAGKQPPHYRCQGH